MCNNLVCNCHDLFIDNSPEKHHCKCGLVFNTSIRKNKLILQINKYRTSVDLPKYKCLIIKCKCKRLMNLYFFT